MITSLEDQKPIKSVSPIFLQHPVSTIRHLEGAKARVSLCGRLFTQDDKRSPFRGDTYGCKECYRKAGRKP